MHHGWACITVTACAMLCKAHLFDASTPTVKKNTCACVTYVSVDTPPPIEINAKLPKKEPTDGED